MRTLQNAVEQSTGLNLTQDLQTVMQTAMQATVLSFNNLAAVVQQPSWQTLSAPSLTLDPLEQAILKLRTSGTSLTYPLDQVIALMAVFSTMQEIAANLNQMASDGSSASTQI